MKQALVALSSALLLVNCAAPTREQSLVNRAVDAETFINRYRLQANVGPLYELVAEDRTVGWLYGAVHYGTEERPSMSPAAVRAMAQTQHVYLEHTDRAGTPWAMRDAIVEDPSAAARAKREAAMASADTVRQGLIAAKKIEKESTGVAIVLSDLSYHEHWALANNYCGVFNEYGTERLARAFASRKEITIHSLETEASRQAALDKSRADRCRHSVVANAAKAGEKPFVIVGRGHLMPGESLVPLLEARGLVLRRID